MKLSAMDKAAVNSTASLAPSTASPATPTVVDPEEESVARTETGLADTDPPSFISPPTYSPTLYSPSDRWLHDGIPAYDWSRDDTYDDYTLDYAYGWEDDGDDDPSVDIVV